MTTLENHRAILKELLEDVDEKVRADLLLQRQKILGFALSEASVHLLAVLLLKNRLISSGFMINHRYFSSIQKAGERFAFDFPQKSEIITLMVEQENFRDRLCYGKHKDKEEVETAVRNLFLLRDLVEKEVGDLQ